MNISSLEIGPMLRALMRNKVGSILIALQIAVTMAIVVNAIAIIMERQDLMTRDSGIDEANSFYLTSTGFATDFNEQVTIDQDLALLRNIPGVIDAIQINAIPISGGGWSMSLQTQSGAEHDGIGTAVYMVDEHGLNALDLELIGGDNFSATDIRWRHRSQPNWPDKTIVTQAMAEALFAEQPWQQALGKTVYINDNEPIIIVGIIDKLQAPWVGWSNVEHAMLSPEKTLFGSTRYFIRTEPGLRDELMPQIEELLATSNKGRIIRRMRSLEETRERSYRQHAAMINILKVIMVVLTIVTALGIVGLASFTVNRRRKQIGTRRALGASQTAILRYFMIENFLISSVGVTIGVALTVGLNILLVEQFSLTPVSWYLIPAGVVTLWLVGQLAVLGPAKKAAGIAPAIATRTV